MPHETRRPARARATSLAAHAAKTAAKTDERRARDRGRQAREEVPLQEPLEAARQVRVPEEERRQRRAVDDGGVEAPGESAFRPFAVLAAVEGHPAVLLAHEVEDGEVREHPPEDERGDGVRGDARGPREERDARVEREALVRVRAVREDAPARGPDVGDVHADDPDEEQPGRGVAVEESGGRAEREEREGQGRRSAEEEEVGAAREQPVRGGVGHGRSDVSPAGPSRRGQRRALDAARGEDRLGGPDAGVLRLLEEREARRVGVREVDAALGREAPHGAREEAGRRAQHRVAPAREVDPRHEAGQVRVRAGEVREDGAGEVLPLRREEVLARLRGLLVREGQVLRQDRRAVVLAGLVRRDDVAERARVVEDVVPRERDARVSFGRPESVTFATSHGA